MTNSVRARSHGRRELLTLMPLTSLLEESGDLWLVEVSQSFRDG